MRAPNCGITPEGWPCIGLTAFSALVFACMGWWLLAVIFLALFFFFFGGGACRKPCGRQGYPH